jgi:DNA-binding NtrC family response regulator
MSNTNASVLIIDDDAAIGTVLEALLRQSGFAPHAVTSAAAGLDAIERRHFEAVLTDVRMPGMDGMQLLEQIHVRWPDLPVILLTAHGTVPLAVEAMKNGATDFLLKPFNRDELLLALRKALALSESAAQAVPAVGAPPGGLIGDSEPMVQVRSLIQRTAAGTATILIRGESGTGKELVARAIHDQSSRRAEPFVTVHCAALPEALLESELFGYEKGAFTGAVTRKPGRVELAQKGTLFLDEIGDVPLPMQVKLLRVLQERRFERLGGQQTLEVDVRFVAATHRPLEAMVASREFREDLFYRLNVVPLWIPPLRDRPTDIQLLARHFCARHGAANGKPRARLEPSALVALQGSRWPGNVRELENFVERLVVLSDGDSFTDEDVRRELSRQPSGEPAPAGDEEPLSLEVRRRQTEYEALSTALRRAANNRTVAARILGVSRRTLYTKLQEHGLL